MEQIVPFYSIRTCLPMSKEEEAKRILGNLISIKQTGLWPLQPESALIPEKDYIAWAVSQATSLAIKSIIFLPLTYENLAFQSNLSVSPNNNEFEIDYWPSDKEWSEMNIYGLETNCQFWLEASILPLVRLEIPISNILSNWAFRLNNHYDQDEKIRSLMKRALVKISSNMGNNLGHYLEYLALRPDVARRKFQWVLRDVWPYCLPYGHLLDKPNSLLVFCAPDDQKKLPYRDPNLPL